MRFIPEIFFTIELSLNGPEIMGSRWMGGRRGSEKKVRMKVEENAKRLLTNMV